MLPKQGKKIRSVRHDEGRRARQTMVFIRVQTAPCEVILTATQNLDNEMRHSRRGARLVEILPSCCKDALGMFLTPQDRQDRPVWYSITNVRKHEGRIPNIVRFLKACDRPPRLHGLWTTTSLRHPGKTVETLLTRTLTAVKLQALSTQPGGEKRQTSVLMERDKTCSANQSPRQHIFGSVSVLAPPLARPIGTAHLL